ncbi:hypothetical protein [Streptomyces sp. BPTC-684]|nr:hypothetical protein [Streptomyces sp. BPTC-684]WHM40909.1 hypothetical protein QIY60_31210 [Streptomyces sp. BPTC-684]
MDLTYVSSTTSVWPDAPRTRAARRRQDPEVLVMAGRTASAREYSA